LQKPGELSVGVTVEVKHTAATPVGAWVEAEATFRAQDGKLYVFEVVARDLGGEVMRGVHKRESWGRHTQLRVPTLGNETSTSTTSTSTATFDLDLDLDCDFDLSYLHVDASFIASGSIGPRISWVPNASSGRGDWGGFHAKPDSGSGMERQFDPGQRTTRSGQRRVSGTVLIQVSVRRR
jgi:hypothetical protein